MILLEENSKPNAQELTEYEKMSGVEKEQFIAKYLKSLPNHRYIEVNLADYVQYISKNGWDTPFTTFILNLDRALNPNVSKTIEQLSDSGVLNPNQPFMKEESLYSEGVSNIIYKIKVLAMVSSKEYQNKYSDIDDFGVDGLRNGKILMNADEMEDKISQWQEQLDSKYNISSKSKIGKNIAKLSNEERDAVEALESLGVDKNDAITIVSGLNMSDKAQEDIVNTALRSLGR